MPAFYGLLAHAAAASEEDDGTYSLEDRIAITILSSLIIFITFCVDLFLLFSPLAIKSRRRTAVYMVLSNVGAMLYVSQFILFVWQLEDMWTWIYYFVTFPLILLPPLVLAWRVTCCYYTTWDLLKCKWSSPMKRKRRGTRWVMTRIILLMIPHLCAFPLVFVDEAIANHLEAALQAVCTCTLLAIAVSHFRIRKSLEVFDLNDSNSLLIFSCCLVVFWIWDQVGWYFVWTVLNQVALSMYLYVLSTAVIIVASTAPCVYSIITGQSKDLRDTEKAIQSIKFGEEFKDARIQFKLAGIQEVYAESEEAGFIRSQPLD